ncbi:maltose acetyltransferase domain-containing protein [Vibrio gangliei]|uniref:maltose acetyltransferase domain-containing protein n=1 Tax=Vibrio gangliei TaxID=2077090 RepID=UPI0024819ADE|nr:maltose acetyltransferase domain-containing protein [Vibrio gangliei]
MSTALEKMRTGERYDINDEELIEIRDTTRDRTAIYNQLPRRERRSQRELIEQIFARVGEDVHIEKSMNIDYGINTYIGSHVFINFNFTVLDCAKVTIGDGAVIGAGSVVTKDIPENAIAFGNPCRVNKING